MNKPLKTPRELICSHVPINDYYAYVLREIHKANMDREKTEERTVDTCIEYIYESSGAKKWYVSEDVIVMLDEITINCEDIQSLVFPHDSFQIIWGSNKFAASMVTLFTNKTLESINKKLGFPITTNHSQLIIKSDCFERSEFGYPVTWDTFRHLNTQYIAHTKLNETEENLAMYIQELVIKVVMLWNARPEIVKNNPNMPLNERAGLKKWQFNQGYSIIKMPTELIIHHESRLAGIKTGTVSPHMRGYVLRHLRHAKYRRNEDGSVRTVLVEPCMVGLKEEKELVP